MLLFSVVESVKVYPLSLNKLIGIVFGNFFDFSIQAQMLPPSKGV